MSDDWVGLQIARVQGRARWSTTSGRCSTDRRDYQRKKHKTRNGRKKVSGQFEKPKVALDREILVLRTGERVRKTGKRENVRESGTRNKSETRMWRGEKTSRGRPSKGNSWSRERERGEVRKRKKERWDFESQKVGSIERHTISQFRWVDPRFPANSVRDATLATLKHFNVSITIY